MVLGAYTLVNTLGLLAGLPYSIPSDGYTTHDFTKTNFLKVIDTYFLNKSDNSIDNSFVKSNLVVIFETDSTNFTFNQNNSFEISVTDNYVFNGNPTQYGCYITFKKITNVDNYYIFKSENGFRAHSSSSSSDTLSFTYFKDFSIKQAYFGVTSSMVPTFSGDSVTGAISSGLGLIPELAQNFGSSFAKLIWNSETSKLTTFGDFALIFLGVAITFSVIKLCLNLLRSKTGV